MKKQSVRHEVEGPTEKPKRYTLALYNPCDDSEPMDVVRTGTDSDLNEFRQAIRGYNAATAYDPHVCYVLAIFLADE